MSPPRTTTSTPIPTPPPLVPSSSNPSSLVGSRRNSPSLPGPSTSSRPPSRPPSHPSFQKPTTTITTTTTATPPPTTSTADSNNNINPRHRNDPVRDSGSISRDKDIDNNNNNVNNKDKDNSSSSSHNNSEAPGSRRSSLPTPTATTSAPAAGVTGEKGGGEVSKPSSRVQSPKVQSRSPNQDIQKSGTDSQRERSVSSGGSERAGTTTGLTTEIVRTEEGKKDSNNNNNPTSTSTSISPPPPPPSVSTPTTTTPTTTTTDLPNNTQQIGDRPPVVPIPIRPLDPKLIERGEVEEEEGEGQGAGKEEEENSPHPRSQASSPGGDSSPNVTRPGSTAVAQVGTGEGRTDSMDVDMDRNSDRHPRQQNRNDDGRQEEEGAIAETETGTGGRRRGMSYSLVGGSGEEEREGGRSNGNETTTATVAAAPARRDSEQSTGTRGTGGGILNGNRNEEDVEMTRPTTVPSLSSSRSAAATGSLEGIIESSGPGGIGIGNGVRTGVVGGAGVTASPTLSAAGSERIGGGRRGTGSTGGRRSRRSTNTTTGGGGGGGLPSTESSASAPVVNVNGVGAGPSLSRPPSTTTTTNATTNQTSTYQHGNEYDDDVGETRPIGNQQTRSRTRQQQQQQQRERLATYNNGDNENQNGDRDGDVPMTERHLNNPRRSDSPPPDLANYRYPDNAEEDPLPNTNGISQSHSHTQHQPPSHSYSNRERRHPQYSAGANVGAPSSSPIELRRDIPAAIPSAVPSFEQHPLSPQIVNHQRFHSPPSTELIHGSGFVSAPSVPGGGYNPNHHAHPRHHNPHPHPLHHPQHHSTIPPSHPIPAAPQRIPPDLTTRRQTNDPDQARKDAKRMVDEAERMNENADYRVSSQTEHILTLGGERNGRAVRDREIERLRDLDEFDEQEAGMEQEERMGFGGNGGMLVNGGDRGRRIRGTAGDGLQMNMNGRGDNSPRMMMMMMNNNHGREEIMRRRPMGLSVHSQGELSNWAREAEMTWLQLAQTQFRMGAYDKAVYSYERALECNPECVEALSRLAEMSKDREEWGKGAELYARALALDGAVPNNWSGLGHCYLLMDDLEKAWTAFYQALRYDPDSRDPYLWYGIGILYDRYQALLHAEQAFSSVIRMDPGFFKANEIYFRLGILYKQQDRLEDALACFEWILEEPPHPLSNVDIFFQIGTTKEALKDYISAREAYETVLEVQPNHAKVLQRLGVLYNTQSSPFYEPEIAIDILTRAIDAAKAQDTENTLGQSWYFLGRAYMATSNYSEAYEAYQQAVYRNGSTTTYWCSIGVLYYNINQYHDALDAYSRAIRIYPFHAEVWFNLGTLYESCNDQMSDAMDAYKRALSLNQNQPDVCARLDEINAHQERGIPLPPPPPPKDLEEALSTLKPSSEARSDQTPPEMRDVVLSPIVGPTPEAARPRTGDRLPNFSHFPPEQPHHRVNNRLHGPRMDEDIRHQTYPSMDLRAMDRVPPPQGHDVFLEPRSPERRGQILDPGYRLAGRRQGRPPRSPSPRHPELDRSFMPQPAAFYGQSPPPSGRQGSFGVAIAPSPPGTAYSATPMGFPLAQYPQTQAPPQAVPEFARRLETMSRPFAEERIGTGHTRDRSPTVTSIASVEGPAPSTSTGRGRGRGGKGRGKARETNKDKDDDEQSNASAPTGRGRRKATSPKQKKERAKPGPKPKAKKAAEEAANKAATAPSPSTSTPRPVTPQVASTSTAAPAGSPQIVEIPSRPTTAASASGASVGASAPARTSTPILASRQVDEEYDDATDDATDALIGLSGAGGSRSAFAPSTLSSLYGPKPTESSPLAAVSPRSVVQEGSVASQSRPISPTVNRGRASSPSRAFQQSKRGRSPEDEGESRGPKRQRSDPENTQRSVNNRSPRSPASLKHDRIGSPSGDSVTSGSKVERQSVGKRSAQQQPSQSPEQTRRRARASLSVSRSPAALQEISAAPDPDPNGSKSPEEGTEEGEIDQLADSPIPMDHDSS